MKTFTYEGITFQPLRQFTKEENANSMSKVIRALNSTLGIHNYSKRIGATEKRKVKWSYKAFYNAAKEVGAGKIDLFEMEGKIVCPCDNELFEYIP